MLKTPMENKITIQTEVNAPTEKVWSIWSDPVHITQWNNASDDWHTPRAKNDLRTGGSFSFTMAAKDGSLSFDFGGTYTEVIEYKKIEYKLVDQRMVEVYFSTSEPGKTKIIEIFDPENENPRELQEQGWHAILNNFKKYTESL
jgi:uncharacterized protein YndB with AHSA1/START domain